jgi:hypothetical protein
VVKSLTEIVQLAFPVDTDGADDRKRRVAVYRFIEHPVVNNDAIPFFGPLAW